MPPYRAQVGGPFGGGTQVRPPAPQFDIASIIDAVVGAKASLTNQAILRAQRQRAEEHMTHQEAVQDQQLQLERDQAAQAAKDKGEDRKLKIAAAVKDGYNPETGTYDPEQSVEVRKERAKRDRVRQAYVTAGIPVKIADAAVENPSIAVHQLFPTQHGDGEGSGLTPEQKKASRGLAATNVVKDNLEAQLSHTPLPSRPRDEDNVPIQNPDRNDRQYRGERGAQRYSADSSRIANYLADSTRVQAKRDTLTSRIDRTMQREDSLAAVVGGWTPPASSAAPAPAAGVMPSAHVQSSTEAMQPRLKALAAYDKYRDANGRLSPALQASYDRVLASLTKQK